MVGKVVKLALGWFIVCGFLFSKNILILATGGTIAGSASVSTQTAGYKAASLGIDRMLQALPELQQIKDVSIKGEQVLQVDSSQMNNELWLKLGKSVSEAVKSSDVDAVVITHGTDTMEETAYFLSLVVKSGKPIVLVGSMRPATALSADGPMNLYNAVLVANDDASKNRGVLVVFNDGIYGARDVSKVNNFRVNAFESPNTGAVGFIHDGIVSYAARTTKLNTTSSEFNIDELKTLPTVDVLFGGAGAVSSRYVDAAIKDKVDALIYAGPGNGSLSDPMREAFKEARKAGIVVVRASRIFAGNVAREDKDDEDGFIASYDLSPLKARVLMMLGLTKSKDVKYLQGLFKKY